MYSESTLICFSVHRVPVGNMVLDTLSVTLYKGRVNTIINDLLFIILHDSIKKDSVSLRLHSFIYNTESFVSVLGPLGTLREPL